ncbi:unnamed protein product, partial [Rotaria magnacalcarata]
DIIFNTTSIVDSDSVKQVQVAIENLTKEIIAQQILFTQCHRDLEQDSNKVNEVLESAEYEWKSKTKSSQQQTDDLFSSTETLLKLCDEIQPTLILATGGTGNQSR